MELKELLFRSGIGRTECANLLRVTERTVQNWVRYGAPDWACERLSLIVGCHPDWYGFKVLAGSLVLPDGELLNRMQLQNIPYQRQLFKNALDSLRILREENEKVCFLSTSSNEENDLTCNIFKANSLDL